MHVHRRAVHHPPIDFDTIFSCVVPGLLASRPRGVVEPSSAAVAVAPSRLCIFGRLVAWGLPARARYREHTLEQVFGLLLVSAAAAAAEEDNRNRCTCRVDRARAVCLFCRRRGIIFGWNFFVSLRPLCRGRG